MELSITASNWVMIPPTRLAPSSVADMPEPLPALTVGRTITSATPCSTAQMAGPTPAATRAAPTEVLAWTGRELHLEMVQTPLGP